VVLGAVDAGTAVVLGTVVAATVVVVRAIVVAGRGRVVAVLEVDRVCA
jgi:hypothetical protein